MYAKPLRKIDAQGVQQRQDAVILNVFSNSLYAHYAGNPGNGFNHGTVHPIVDDIFDERAINLEKIDRKIL